MTVAICYKVSYEMYTVHKLTDRRTDGTLNVAYSMAWYRIVPYDQELKSVSTITEYNIATPYRVQSGLIFPRIGFR